MSAVIAINYLSGFIALADTRVTYPNGTYDDKHGIQKIIPIIGDRTVGVIGYAGSLDAARIVLDFVHKHKIMNLSKPIVIDQIGLDLYRWIVEASYEVSEAQLTNGLTIMFCGSDARRRQRAKVEDRWYLMPFYDWHCFTYKVKSPGNVNMNKTQVCSAAGILDNPIVEYHNPRETRRNGKTAYIYPRVQI